MIYLVTEGEYSDYGIVHAFSDEDAANKHVEQWNALHNGGSSERRVEAYEVETEPPKLTVLHFAGWVNGSPLGDDVWTNQIVIEDVEQFGILDRLETRRYPDGSSDHTYKSLDQERAMKVVSDARAKTLAEAAGL